MRRAADDARLASTALLAFLLAVLPTLAPAQGPLGGLRRGVQSQALLRQGRVLYEAGDYQAARDRLRDAVALDLIRPRR